MLGKGPAWKGAGRTGYVCKAALGLAHMRVWRPRKGHARALALPRNARSEDVNGMP